MQSFYQFLGSLRENKSKYASETVAKSDFVLV